MLSSEPESRPAVWSRHRWLNRLQTVLLMLTLLGIAAISGHLLLGDQGLWLSLAIGIVALLVEPTAASQLTLRLYRARALHPGEAPEIWSVLRELAIRAELPVVPVPYYVPSAVVNAFATGSKNYPAIALTDGLMRSLTPRELAGVLGHEVAHIANGDMRVMGLADFISRLTQLMSLLGQFSILLSMPALLLGLMDISWSALIFLVIAPQLALLAQLGLSRVREFDADRLAAELTGDPMGLASALAKIERVSRSWKAWVLPGWGNPEPSWLRTHPATAERIERLQELSVQIISTPSNMPHFSPEVAVVPPRPPRWRYSGLWR